MDIYRKHFRKHYRKHFYVKQVLSSTAMKKIVQKFEMHGTCHNRNKENLERRVTARTKTNIGTVLEPTERSPRKSLRRYSSEPGLTNVHVV